MLKVVCVLKSGGDFDEDYVFALRDGVRRGLTVEHDFVCFTDRPIRGIRNRLLTDGLAGWFSKFEIFSELGPVIYFDLDTIIFDNFDRLALQVLIEPESFYMLEAFNARRTWASGIMAWKGDWSWLTSYCKRYAGLYQTDQECINKALRAQERTPKTILRKEYGIYSYKHHCRDKIPEDTNIICFHGKPRPKEIGWI